MQKGFSLIELLVAIAIIGLFSTIGLVGFSGQKQEIELQKVVEDLISDLREAQSMSSSTFKCNNGPALYFGVKRKNNSSYEIYCRNAIFNTEEIIKTVLLPNTISLTAGGVMFDAPSALRGSLGYNDFVLAQSVIKIIKINTNGQISAD